LYQDVVDLGLIGSVQEVVPLRKESKATIAQALFRGQREIRLRLLKVIKAIDRVDDGNGFTDILKGNLCEQSVLVVPV